MQMSKIPRLGDKSYMKLYIQKKYIYYELQFINKHQVDIPYF